MIFTEIANAKRNESAALSKNAARRGMHSSSSSLLLPQRNVRPANKREDAVNEESKFDDEKEPEKAKANTNTNNGNDKKFVNKQDDEFRGRIEADIIDEVPDVSFKDVQGLTGVKLKFVGDAERIMRTLFAVAREKAPSIIFIDEIDSLLTARGGANEAESSRRIKTEFLVQFDGVHKASEAQARMLVIGATNLPHQLDEAVLRRFSKRIMVPLPDEETRYALLQNLMKKQKCELTPWDFKEVVKCTHGYSFSDLTGLCKDAAMGPVRELGADIITTSFQDIPPISKKHFLKSLENVKPSVPEKSIAQYVEWNEKFGSQKILFRNALWKFLFLFLSS
ncbi:AAA family ATPase [Reticulomyxa filosa]|uniref:AAA family ATPase n=1 Tax=Reticulomyxa filosa TaxID=46433 RepID=X6PA86_RETFI|nr:AAA family ATPase [Reticulomyxa filosa]|eukprot:ETO34562.1 AAA family ATPase [Reticulomyxa filosa]